jgi:site-specific recombinase XerC
MAFQSSPEVGICQALGSFFAFLEDGGRERVQDIGPLDVRDYLEAVKANGLSTATLKQHMAAVRMLFDHLVTGGVLEHNPALSVKAPRQRLGKGKTCKGRGPRRVWPLKSGQP